MANRCKSYLTVAAILFTVVAAVPGAKAQRIFLDPDTVFVTTGVNTEFDLELRVDADVASLKLFVFWVAFDASKLDTVSVTEGPLFPSGGPMTIFNYYLIGDSVLQLEGLIMGAGVDVAGPGVLATVKLRAVDTGFTDMPVLHYQTNDVTNTPFESEASGTSIFVNCPPDEFGLLSPVSGEIVSGLPGDEFDLVWNSSQSMYPGESVTYTVEYGTSPTFDPTGTTTLYGLSDTTHTLSADDLVEGTYYWRVTAVGDLYGFERPSAPAADSFEFVYGLVEPEEFDLLMPGDSTLIDIFGKGSILFDWEDAVSVIPGDTIGYEFCLGPDPGVPIGAVIVDSVEEASELWVSTDDLPIGEWDYWRVNAVNKFGLNTWSTSVRSTMFYHLGDLNHDRVIDIADLTRLISFLYITYEPPVPIETANCDCQGQADIGDVTTLIRYLYLGGELLPCD